MKVKFKTPDRLVTSDGNLVVPLIGGVFAAILLSVPYWATADISVDAIQQMRWTAFAALGLTVWAATSKHLRMDHKDQQIIWRRRFYYAPFLPFLNQTIKAPLSAVIGVKLKQTRHYQSDVANLLLLLSDGRELRLTHSSATLEHAEISKKRLETWLEQYA